MTELTQLYTSNQTVYALEVNATNHDELLSIGMSQDTFDANTMGATMTAVIDSSMPRIVGIMAATDFSASYTAVPA